MLLPKTAITAAFWLLTSPLASSLPSSTQSSQLIDGKPLPHKYHEITFNETTLSTSEYESESGLEKRTPGRICNSILAGAASACVILTFAKTFSESMGSTIKDLSNGGSCDNMEGTFNSLRWEYYSSGRNCDTTAQQDTIAGAIYKYLHEQQNDQICGTECLRFDHGGTYHGWLKLGPKSAFNEDAYCGPSLTFDHCLEGGNNDI